MINTVLLASVVITSIHIGTWFNRIECRASESVSFIYHNAQVKSINPYVFNIKNILTGEEYLTTARNVEKCEGS
jgi:hypothetical protein